MNSDIVSILKQSEEGILGIVCGHGRNDDNLRKKDSAYCTFDFKGKDDIGLIKAHEKDSIIYDDEKLCYKMFDGNIFPCVLAEKITLSKERKIPPVDNSMSVAEKLELWNLGAYCFYDKISGGMWAGINTHKYSICFELNSDGSGIYCRIGKNGYTNKGWAMLSTICLRNNEIRMIDDNMENLNDYIPDLDAFVVDGCSFPQDGGWYWSVASVSDDCIKLNGCGGVTYEIYRVNTNNHEFII